MATLIGTSGNDSLIGTSGNDLIDNGAGGVDTILAGAGDDIVHFVVGPTQDHSLQAVLDGGSGYDILDLSGLPDDTSSYQFEAIATGDHTFNLSQHSFTSTGTVVDPIGTATSFEEVHLSPHFYFDGYAFNDPHSTTGWKIIGSDGSNLIDDSRSDDTILGGAGGDEVRSHGGNDQVSLGANDDFFTLLQLSGNADHSTIDGGAGRDVFEVESDAAAQGGTVDLMNGIAHVGAATFTLTGFEDASIVENTPFGNSDWHATMLGGQASDTLQAIGGGDALLLGRGGNDYLNADNQSAGGSDDVSFAQGSVTAYGGSGDDQVYGGQGADWLFGDGHYAGDTVPAGSADGGSDILYGEGGNDHIYGNSLATTQGAVDGNDFIDGGDGSDYVNGNAGSDVILGGNGSDRLYGGAGDDTIFGDHDRSTPDDGGGNDHINGNKGNDSLYGGGGNDEILGGQGNDTLEGGSGTDTLTGGLGDDTFVVERHDLGAGGQGSLPDLITDFQYTFDRLATHAAISEVLHPGSAADYAAAFTLAEGALDVSDPAHPDSWQDAAAVQVGNDTYLFWDNFGEGPESAVRLGGIQAIGVNNGFFAFGVL